MRHSLHAILYASLSSSRAFSSPLLSSFIINNKNSPATLARVGSSSIRHHRHNIIRSSSSSSHHLKMTSSADDDGGSATKNLVVDPFCFRQFSEKESSKGYAGAVFNISIEQFEEIVNSRYDVSNLQPGYAPFCKHIFLTNDFTDARLNVLPITSENEHALRTKYEARNERELPVLTRYFDKELLLEGKEESEVFPVAKYLDLILYSREQIEKENAAMGEAKEYGEVEKKAPWGIVSIKAQDVDHEHPMTPITAMRNALGKDQGGSGVELVRESYMEAYEYWKDHANVL
mmetsp:Transcript_23287/g.50338  ORF Transcript_23287/g.50338 Transcript_23287/m.50338 type:complete len:289 (+) Transcript_23287:63-929(+)